jgi:hypothetical protein
MSKKNEKNGGKGLKMSRSKKIEKKGIGKKKTRKGEK